MAVQFARQASAASVLFLVFTTPCFVARRVKISGYVRTDAGDSCKQSASSCVKCLQSTGPCMWCPAQLWNGNATYLGKRMGVCGRASEMQDVWCGGDGWSVATSTSGKPYAAKDVNEATSNCPDTNMPNINEIELPNEKDEWKVGPLSTITGATIKGMDDQNVGRLATLLDRIAMDLRRFRIFQDINPLLFEQNFNPDSGSTLKYVWKGAILGFGFLDLGFGGVLSSAIALAAGGITDVTEEFMKDMSVSQKKLIEKGGGGGVQYFSDITFGVLKECYLRVRELPQETISQLMQSLVQNDGGTLAGHFHQAHSSSTGKALKFTTQAGLFAGGFFTGGVTWMIGAGLGVADYASAVTAEEVSKNAAERKLELLLGIARSRCKSAWDDTGEACSIIGTESQCGPSVPPGSDRPIPRFCSRGSVWNHHVAVIPEGEVSPEGRCLPTRLPQLPDGFPCHAHSNCKSSYCHYEPRLQFFISDHIRRYCESGSGSCYESMLQLTALSKVVPRPASHDDFQQLERTLRGFVGKYDSYEAVEFATTGTCATACAMSDIGSGTCSHAGHTGKFGVQKSRTKSANEKFSYEIGDNKSFPVIFEKIGDGMCTNYEGDLLVAEEIDMISDSVRECAGHCTALGMSAFVIHHIDDTFKCKVLKGRPGTVKKTTSGNMACYDTELPWPLDAYQPWNRVWRNYRSEMRQILGKLHMDETSTLPKVIDAYRSFCIEPDKVDHRGHPLLIESCFHPRDWDANMAESALMHMSPLSAKQLHTLYEQIFN